MAHTGRSPERGATCLTNEQARRSPKVLLHDHLDGGLRPHTVIDLANRTGYTGLPYTDADRLRAWFVDSATTGSLDDYLRCFHHTHAVMQTREALFRVASECAQDLAADGVVYAESRFAPDLHTGDGLTPEAVVEIVADGFAEGERCARRRGQFIRMAILLCGNRQADSTLDVARLCVTCRPHRVRGFDIAGPERDHPPGRQLESFELLNRHGVPYTIHAGEDAGLGSIAEAVLTCGARRIGHGVRLVDAVDGSPAAADFPFLAEAVRSRSVCLEMCPTSNVQTGAIRSLSEHPLERLRLLGHRVTVNTDNRLLSGKPLSQEFSELAGEFGHTVGTVEELTGNALAAAFLAEPERDQLHSDIIGPGFQALHDDWVTG